MNHVCSRRLPRKYSSDRHRDTSAPIVGSSGATPLHFAAANGHEHVVLTLLLHGALPDRPDKHNVTPEMLARQNGWTRCAELLRKWTLEKDRDLRERATLTPELDGLSRNECESRPFDKKLNMKHPIDNALNMIRRRCRPLRPRGRYGKMRHTLRCLLPCTDPRRSIARLTHPPRNSFRRADCPSHTSSTLRPMRTATLIARA